MSAKSTLEAYCTLVQASRISGYSPQHLRYLADTGKIGMIRDPMGRRLLLIRDVQEVAKHRQSRIAKEG